MTPDQVYADLVRQGYTEEHAARRSGYAQPAAPILTPTVERDAPSITPATVKPAARPARPAPTEAQKAWKSGSMGGPRRRRRINCSACGALLTDANAYRTAKGSTGFRDPCKACRGARTPGAPRPVAVPSEASRTWSASGFAKPGRQAPAARVTEFVRVELPPVLPRTTPEPLPPRTRREPVALTLLPRGADLSWQQDALCAQVDADLWFPEKGGSTREAKKVCLSCDVRADCLEYALDGDERFGIWGGMSERERRRMKRARQDGAA